MKAVLLPGAGCGPAVGCSPSLSLPQALCRSLCCPASSPHTYNWNKNATLWEVKWKLISWVFFKFLSIDISALSAVVNWNNTFRHYFYLMTTKFSMEMNMQNLGSWRITTVWGLWSHFLSFPFKKGERTLPNLLATFNCVTLRTPKISFYFFLHLFLSLMVDAFLWIFLGFMLSHSLWFP